MLLGPLEPSTWCGTPWKNNISSQVDREVHRRRYSLDWAANRGGYECFFSLERNHLFLPLISWFVMKPELYLPCNENTGEAVLPPVNFLKKNKKNKDTNWIWNWGLRRVRKYKPSYFHDCVSLYHLLKLKSQDDVSLDLNQIAWVLDFQ